MGSNEFDRLRVEMLKEALDPIMMGALGVSGLAAAGAGVAEAARRVGKWRNAGKLKKVKELNKAKELARGNRAQQALSFAGHGAPKGISSSHKNLALAGGAGAAGALALSDKRRSRRSNGGFTVIKSAMLRTLEAALLVKRAGLTTWDPFKTHQHAMDVEKIRAKGQKNLTRGAMRHAKDLKRGAGSVGKTMSKGKNWKNLAIAGLGGFAANNLMNRD